MDAFSVYKYYLAMKFHFTVAGYDIFKHQGRVKANRINFEEKNLRARMERLSKLFSKPPEVVSFFLACNLYDADVFSEQESMDAWMLWKRRSEMMTQHILNELSDQVTSIDDPLAIAKLVSGKFLSYETAVALCRHVDILPKITDSLIYSKIGDKIAKTNRFVKYDESKVKQFIQAEYGQAA